MGRRYKYNQSPGLFPGMNLDNGIAPRESNGNTKTDTALTHKVREHKVKRAKNPNGGGSIRQKSSGNYEGRIMIDGKSFSVTGNSIEDVQSKLFKIRYPLSFDTSIKPENMTVAQFIEQWRGTYTRDIKKSTMQRYDLDIRLRIVPLIGNCKLEELKPVQITQLYNFVQDQGLSQKSIKNLHGTLHRILQDAVDNEYMQRNVADRAKIPKATEPAQEMRPFTDTEVPVFLEKIKGHKFEALYFVALFTGMRESELIGLTWDCIDWEHGRIRIYRQLPRDQEKGVADTFTTLKNGKSREIAPAAEVFSVLRQIKRAQMENQLKSGGKWSNPEGFVFTNENGEHVKRVTVYNNFKRIVTEMGLPDVRFHDLRHTYATISIQQGVDIKTVSHNLGHATVAFTLDKYGHVSERMKDDSAEKMSGYIAKVQ